ncbi:MAG: hypothetical protein R3175_11980 [Marinobacter sp.]|uniref:hypothetical protein n=1 Tax=Marinobacter sp. TaxID=50741 RepID=UPI00299D64AB|nr:hypothetical protein [Marinobacter sp.]MDX1756772.1 hypothetical protein [Marinobacter sp.]
MKNAVFARERLLPYLQRRALRKTDRRMDRWHRGLRKAFRTAHPGLPAAHQLQRVAVRTGHRALLALPEHWWTAYAGAVKATVAELPAFEARLLESTRQLSAERLDTSQWLELYRVCLISGLYVAALAVRQLAENRARDEAARPGASLDQLRTGFAVALETGDEAGARDLLGRLAQVGESHEHLEHAAWLVDLVTVGEVAPFADGSHADNPVTQLRAALEGNTVALVGPVPVEAAQGAEIDRFDLVAKFNYRGGGLGCDPETQGRRVDIAYYNIQQSKYIARKLDPGFLAHLAFPVFIKDKGLRLLSPWAPSGRVLRNLQWLLLDSEFNAGPNAVYDLLRFAPARLKVFNTDLMLTAGRFQGYAQPGGEEINYSFSFAKTHDPVIQFRFLQCLWRTGRIEGDERFDKVMKLSLDDYIRKLQDGHGEIARESLNGCERRN